MVSGTESLLTGAVPWLLVRAEDKGLGSAQRCRPRSTIAISESQAAHAFPPAPLVTPSPSSPGADSQEQLTKRPAPRTVSESGSGGTDLSPLPASLLHPVLPVILPSDSAEERTSDN